MAIRNAWPQNITLCFFDSNLVYVFVQLYGKSCPFEVFIYSRNMVIVALYVHRQPYRIHTLVFHENQQVQLLSDADDFDTVDSGPGGNTDWVRDCIGFHIQLRSRMDVPWTCVA